MSENNKKFLDYAGLTKLKEKINDKYVSKNDIATTSNAGVVKPDGSTIKIDENGVITANSIIYVTKAQYDALGDAVLTDGKTYAIIDMPAGFSDVASNTDFGVVKINGETIAIDENGFLYIPDGVGGATEVIITEDGEEPEDADNKLQLWVDTSEDAVSMTVPIATTISAGTVKPDGTSITITNDGTISSAVKNRTFYCTCISNGDVSNKIVECYDGSLNINSGTIIVVKFLHTNTAENVTLNIENKGAKPIKVNSVNYTGSSSSYCGYESRYCAYMYDGSSWIWISKSWEDKPITETKTLLATGWSGTSIPYTYDLGYASTYDVEVMLPSTATADEVLACQKAQIISSGNDNILRAWGEKPTVDISIVAKKVVK